MAFVVDGKSLDEWIEHDVEVIIDWRHHILTVCAIMLGAVIIVLDKKGDISSAQLDVHAEVPGSRPILLYI